MLSSIFTANYSYSSINPQYEIIPLFYIPQLEPQVNKINKLEGPQFKLNKKKTSITGHKSSGNLITVDKEDLIFFYDISKSVFQTKTKSSTSTMSTTIHNGTAFHIGQNILATNYHVVYPAEYSGGCNNFEVVFPMQSNKKEKIVNTSVRCENILYCDSFEDICFLKMQTFRFEKKQYSLEDFSPALSFSDEINEKNPRFRQFGKKKDKSYTDGRTIYYSVNNSNGFGIQGSAGQGGIYQNQVRGFYKNCEEVRREKRRMKCIKQRLKNTTKMFSFHASAFPGASGSPLLNGQGQVLGITRAITTSSYGPNARTRAVPTSKIIEILAVNEQAELLNIIIGKSH